MTLREYIDRLRGRTVAVIGIGVSNTPLLRKSWARWPASWRLPGQSSSWGTDIFRIFPRT